ncbi:MarR family winged helix-turn-helix transcriptional regulator [Maridesulfovibrio sp. FT414]|uniref:MarR family winged helix-turn-helix transcriptional regulator n=1 Tax=Maridesulfovibrio sp. FT414 TaxID=2979469 RepID=UPI003D8014CD
MSRQASFGYMVSQMVRLHKSVLSDKLEKFGITYCQIGFIMQAVRHPGRTQDEISTVLSVDKGATARAVARLEKDGFIYREENPENRRQKLVYPSKKSLAVFDELHLVLRESNELMLTGLSLGEREVLLDLITRIIDNCRERLDMPRVWEIL